MRLSSTRLRSVLAATFVVFAATGLGALPADREVKQYVRRSWSIEQGLPHGTVRGFAQTSDGYLWLATYEGIVRFNGEHFRVFDHANTAGIPNSTILSVTRGRDDTLWLGTVAGLVRSRNGEFQPIAREPGVPDEQVLAIEEAPDGTIWVGTWGGLNKVVGDRLQRVKLPVKSVLVNALLPVHDGSLWIGLTSGGLIHRTAAGAIDEITTADGLASDTVICLLADGPDAIYAGTASGLDHVRNGVVTHIPGLPADQITALRKDRDGNLWIGTYSNGLFRMNGGALSSYGIADGLLNPTVRGIFEDDEGSIWVGSNRGLEQMRTGLFTTWNKNSGLSDDFTRAIFEDRDGVLWAGTAHGLSRSENGVWTTVTDSPLSRAYVLSIAQSVDGAYWFGTSNGLYRVFEGSTTLLTTADGLSNNGIRAIFAPRDGGVWLATDASVTRIHADGRIETFEDRGWERSTPSPSTPRRMGGSGSQRAAAWPSSTASPSRFIQHPRSSRPIACLRSKRTKTARSGWRPTEKGSFAIATDRRERSPRSMVCPTTRFSPSPTTRPEISGSARCAERSRLPRQSSTPSPTAARSGSPRSCTMRAMG